jgi:hypothetical protein
MVSCAIWKKNMHEWLSKLHESEGRVQFEVFEKLTSVCFFKFHEKPYLYYLLIIYMKKLYSTSYLEIKKVKKVEK